MNRPPNIQTYTGRLWLVIGSLRRPYVQVQAVLNYAPASTAAGRRFLYLLGRILKPNVLVTFTPDHGAGGSGAVQRFLPAVEAAKGMPL